MSEPKTYTHTQIKSAMDAEYARGVASSAAEIEVLKEQVVKYTFATGALKLNYKQDTTLLRECAGLLHVGYGYGGYLLDKLKSRLGEV
jgi:hypothetical protein